jgi:hypothetical protein
VQFCLDVYPMAQDPFDAEFGLGVDGDATKLSVHAAYRERKGTHSYLMCPPLVYSRTLRLGTEPYWYRSPPQFWINRWALGAR